MACPSQQTYCPICMGLLSAEEIAATPPDEYPTHYSCRVAMQDAEERMDADDDEREYRNREENATE